MGSYLPYLKKKCKWSISSLIFLITNLEFYSIAKFGTVYIIEHIRKMKFCPYFNYGKLSTEKVHALILRSHSRLCLQRNSVRVKILFSLLQLNKSDISLINSNIE